MEKTNTDKESRGTDGKAESSQKPTKPRVQSTLASALAKQQLPSTKTKFTTTKNTTKEKNTKDPPDQSNQLSQKTASLGNENEDSVLGDDNSFLDGKVGIAHRRPKDNILPPDNRDGDAPSLVSPWSDFIREWTEAQDTEKELDRPYRFVNSKELFGEDDSSSSEFSGASDASEATQETSNTGNTHMSKVTLPGGGFKESDDASFLTHMSDDTFLQGTPQGQDNTSSNSDDDTQMSEVTTNELPPPVLDTFFMLKLELGAISGNSGFPQLREKLCQTIGALQEADPKLDLIFHDPKAQDLLAGDVIPKLSLSEETTWNELKPFTSRLPRLNHKSKPVAYLNVRLRHTISHGEMQDILASYGPELNVDIWRKRLQVPDSREIGWLMLSHKMMPIEELEASLRGIIRSPISLRWRCQPGFVQTDDNGWDLRQQNRAALFVEVPLKTFDIVNNSLKAIYSPTPRPHHLFPLGIRMTFVTENPQEFRRRSPYRSAQAQRCWDNQESFVLSTIVIPSAQFITLDTPVEGWGPNPAVAYTIRDMMMSLTAPKQSHYSLFHALAIRYQGSTLVTTALAYPQWEKKARHVMSFPLTHIRHLVPHAQEAQLPGTFERLNQQFTRHSVEEADNTVYCFKRKQVVNRGRTGFSAAAKIVDPHLSRFLNPENLALQLQHLGVSKASVSGAGTVVTGPGQDLFSDVGSDDDDQKPRAQTPPKKRLTATATPDRSKTKTTRKRESVPKRQKKSLPGQGDNTAGQPP